MLKLSSSSQWKPSPSELKSLAMKKTQARLSCDGGGDAPELKRMK